MNGRQRILTALGRGVPDTVPVWELAFNEASVIGLAARFADPGDLPPVKNIVDMTDAEVLKLLNAYRVMGQGLGLDGFTATALAPMERVDEHHFRDVYGVVHRESDVGEPFPVKGPISGPDDLKNFKMRPPQEGDFLLIEIMRGYFPDCAIAFMMPGPFARSRDLTGSLENILANYALQPSLVRDLARMTTDHCLAALELIAARGADFVVTPCDQAFIHNTMMSPAHYDEFISPYQKEIVTRGHALGLKMVKHSDGKVQKLLPRYIEEGYDGLHPFQPQCIDIGEAKREYGDRACLIGNIDCAYLLVYGTPEEVRASVQETIARAAPGGGYIISTSNTVHPGVRPENYIAMVEAAREYGKY